jgi:hypothetical protein
MSRPTRTSYLEFVSSGNEALRPSPTRFYIRALLYMLKENNSVKFLFLQMILHQTSHDNGKI